jgi:hypothetical protein
VTGFSTYAVHGSRSQQQDLHGALRPPLYDSIALNTKALKTFTRFSQAESRRMPILASQTPL